MKKINLANVKEASDGNKLPPGGYVCKYTKVEDVPEQEYLSMEFDIAEGEHKGHYKELEKERGFWGGRAIRSYKEKAKPFFKRMCSAVAKSNPGFVFDAGEQNADEKTLVGKLVGLVLAEEEYIGNDGNLKTRLYVHKECDVKEIREGKFKIPNLKELSAEAKGKVASNNDFMNVPEGDDEAIPFD